MGSLQQLVVASPPMTSISEGGKIDGLPIEETHIGRFTAAECQRVIDICKARTARRAA